MYAFKFWLEDEGDSVTTVARRTGISPDKLTDLCWGDPSRLTAIELERLSDLTGIPADRFGWTIEKLRECGGAW